MKKLLVDSCVFIDAFDPGSPAHDESLTLLRALLDREILISMPAHAWFEIQCSLQRLNQERRYRPAELGAEGNYPIELIHIDDQFIRKYSMADLPYIKAGDHIFVAVAKVNQWPLITNDTQMAALCMKCEIKVYTPKQYIDDLG